MQRSPISFGTVGVTASQWNKYGCNAIGQCFGQQIGSRFLPYLAYLEIFASLKGSIFDVLGLVGKDNPGQRLHTYKCTVVHLLAEGICRNAIGRIYIKTVWMKSVLACIHADGGIGNVQQLPGFLNSSRRCLKSTAFSCPAGSVG